MQENQAKRLALPAGKGGKNEAKIEAWSCLDGLWEALRAGPRLRAQQPAVLAHALRALLAMWQVQPPNASFTSSVCISVLPLHSRYSWDNVASMCNVCKTSLQSSSNNVPGK